MVQMVQHCHEHITGLPSTSRTLGIFRSTFIEGEINVSLVVRHTGNKMKSVKTAKLVVDVFAFPLEEQARTIRGCSRCH